MKGSQQQSETQLSAEHAFISEALSAESNAILHVINTLNEDSKYADSWVTSLDILENCRGHVVFSGNKTQDSAYSYVSDRFNEVSSENSNSWSVLRRNHRGTGTRHQTDLSNG